MDPNNGLDIISWNCRSVYKKLFELKRLVYKRRPHLVCLQETWVKDDYLPSFINYKSFFQNRQGRAGGGLAICVRSDVIALEVPLQMVVGSKLECQCVEVKLRSGGGHLSIKVLNIYNPNEIVSHGEFNTLFGQLGQRSAIVGDFNAHHPSWDGRVQRPCTSGKNLMDAAGQNHLQLLTPQSMPTYLDPRSGRVSTLDLCFVSAVMYHRSTIQLGEDIGSDHCSIFVSDWDLSRRCPQKGSETVAFSGQRHWRFRNSTPSVEQLRGPPSGNFQPVHYRCIGVYC